MNAWLDDVRYALSTAVTNCLNFSGRASPTEFWQYVITAGIVSFVLSLILPLAVALVLSLFLWVPEPAAMVRRLHDSGRSWLFLLVFHLPVLAAIGVNALFDIGEPTSTYVNFAPIFPGLYVVWLLTRPGDEGTNQYGPPPRQPRVLPRHLRKDQSPG